MQKFRKLLGIIVYVIMTNKRFLHLIGRLPLIQSMSKNENLH